MFGSAKYRSYEYGADDHVAVVHTEKLKEDALLFSLPAQFISRHTMVNSITAGISMQKMPML